MITKSKENKIVKEINKRFKNKSKKEIENENEKILNSIDELYANDNEDNRIYGNVNLYR